MLLSQLSILFSRRSCPSTKWHTKLQPRTDETIGVRTLVFYYPNSMSSTKADVVYEACNE